MTAYLVGPRGPEPLNVFEQSNRLPHVEDPDKGCFALCDWRRAGLWQPQRQPAAACRTRPARDFCSSRWVLMQAE